MKNFIKFFGIIAVLAVISLSIGSCDLEFTWEFVNRSFFTVNVFDTNFDPSSFTLESGASRTFTNSNTSVSMQYTPADKVVYDTSSTLKGGTITFTNK